MGGNKKYIVSEQVENKFLIMGKKRSVYVKNEDEIDKLIKYLDFDFVAHESSKLAVPTRITDTEFVVSCDYRLSLVATYPSDSMGYMFSALFSNGNQWNRDVEKSMSLDGFMNPEQYPEELLK